MRSRRPIRPRTRASSPPSSHASAASATAAPAPSERALLAARLGEDLVAIDREAPAFPVLEDISELPRHLLIECRLGSLRVLLRVEERDRQHFPVRGQQLEVTLVPGQPFDERADDRLRLIHRPLRRLDVDPFEARDTRDHGPSFLSNHSAGANLSLGAGHCGPGEARSRRNASAASRREATRRGSATGNGQRHSRRSTQIASSPAARAPTTSQAWATISVASLGATSISLTACSYGRRSG